MNSNQFIGNPLCKVCGVHYLLTDVSKHELCAKRYATKRLAGFKKMATALVEDRDDAYSMAAARIILRDGLELVESFETRLGEQPAALLAKWPPEPCKKCGSTDINTVWVGELGAEDIRRVSCNYPLEHLHRNCRECQFRWDDEILERPISSNEIAKEAFERGLQQGNYDVLKSILDSMRNKNWGYTGTDGSLTIKTRKAQTNGMKSPYIAIAGIELPPGTTGIMLRVDASDPNVLSIHIRRMKDAYSHFRLMTMDAQVGPPLIVHAIRQILQEEHAQEEKKAKRSRKKK